MKYLSLRDDPLAKILSFLSLKNSTQVRRKAVYALSSLIRLNAQAIGLIERYGGWEILKAALIGLVFTFSIKFASLTSCE